MSSPSTKPVGTASKPVGQDRVRSGEKPRSGLRRILIPVILAFVGGVILTGWLIANYDPFGREDDSVETVVEPESPVEELAARIDPDGTVRPPETVAVPVDEEAMAALTPAKQRALAVRVADLEDRLSRINVQAQAASGNAARAEGLLIAFAARRALDTGSPLGYIEQQLRLRFGDAQPRAVTTIVNASRDPVTLEELAAGLDDIGPALTSGSSGRGFWTDVRRELGELFVIRREGTPSPAPQQRLTRAERYIENGNVEAAIAEIEKLPGSVSGDEAASGWLEKARQYNEARRALDVIETAAILEPQQLRAADGERVDQPSPLGPAALPR